MIHDGEDNELIKLVNDTSNKLEKFLYPKQELNSERINPLYSIICSNENKDIHSMYKFKAVKKYKPIVIINYKHNFYGLTSMYLYGDIKLVLFCITDDEQNISSWRNNYKILKRETSYEIIDFLIKISDFSLETLSKSSSQEPCSTTMLSPEPCSTTMLSPETRSTSILSPETRSTSILSPETWSTSILSPELTGSSKSSTSLGAQLKGPNLYSNGNKPCSPDKGKSDYNNSSQTHFPILQRLYPPILSYHNINQSTLNRQELAKQSTLGVQYGGVKSVFTTLCDLLPKVLTSIILYYCGTTDIRIVIKSMIDRAYYVSKGNKIKFKDPKIHAQYCASIPSIISFLDFPRTNSYISTVKEDFFENCYQETTLRYLSLTIFFSEQLRVKLDIKNIDLLYGINFPIDDINTMKQNAIYLFNIMDCKTIVIYKQTVIEGFDNDFNPYLFVVCTNDLSMNIVCGIYPILNPVYYTHVLDRLPFL